jgi:hypothetical protein
VYIGDTIKIKYGNGFTETWKLVTPLSTYKWQRVPGTLRDADGRDPNQPNPTTSTATYGEQTIVRTGNGNTLTFRSVPVIYNVPGSRIDRRGVVTIVTITGNTQEDKYLE